jgi:hypothetical protein
VVPSIRNLIRQVLGPSFVDPPSLSSAEHLAKAYETSFPTSPLLLLLIPGGGGAGDPLVELTRLAESKKNRRLVALSMGQGQGPVAEQAIMEAIDTGRYLPFSLFWSPFRPSLFLSLFLFLSTSHPPAGGYYCKTAIWLRHGCQPWIA